MSKTSELLRRINPRPKAFEQLLTLQAETPVLWPRFAKVRAAIDSSLQKTPPQGITRQFTMFSWSGEDSGIHNLNGRIHGITNGVELTIQLKGTSVNDEQYKILPLYSKLEGDFVSADGQKGSIEMQHTNGNWEYQAFWFQIGDGSLRLEQVIGPDGKIYDAGKLEPGKKEITIPGTRVDIKRFI